MKRGQVFGIPTYDALFKWILSEDSIRPSFFHAFIPEIAVESSKRLDEHMNPWQELQLLRNKLHDSGVKKLVDDLKNKQDKIQVTISNAFCEKTTDLLNTFLIHFNDIQYSFPKEKFNGKMDFVCKLDSGEYALIEMQVMPEDHWDRRALAYIASFFGNQLRKGDSWKDIRKVIGLNILGGGRNNEKHWPEAPKQFVRHYKFQEQLCKTPPLYLEGIDLIQYSLANAPENVDTREKQDWLLFLKNAHNMTEKDVEEKIETKAVQEAFERAKLTSLPEVVRNSYEKEEVMYENLSTYMEKEKAKGLAEGMEKGREEGREEGIAEGMEKGIAEGMEKGIAEGMEKGIAEGMEKGIAEGIEKGIAEGMEKGIAEGMEKGIAEGMEKGREEAKKKEQKIAKAMLARGISLEVIKEITDLSEEDISLCS